MIKYLILLLLSVSVNAQVTFKQAQEVFTQLQNVSGQHVVLKYSKDSYSNAYCTRYNIIITQGMLNDCRNKADLATVLGHELGHWIRKDPRKGHPKQEIYSDKIGNELCKKAGYKHCGEFRKIISKMND